MPDFTADVDIHKSDVMSEEETKPVLEPEPEAEPEPEPEPEQEQEPEPEPEQDVETKQGDFLQFLSAYHAIPNMLTKIKLYCKEILILYLKLGT